MPIWSPALSFPRASERQPTKLWRLPRNVTVGRAAAETILTRRPKTLRSKICRSGDHGNRRAFPWASGHGTGRPRIGVVSPGADRSVDLRHLSAERGECSVSDELRDGQRPRRPCSGIADVSSASARFLKRPLTKLQPRLKLPASPWATTANRAQRLTRSTPRDASGSKEI